MRDGPWASDALLTSTSPLSILECQGLPIVNGQCDPYATVTLAGPCRQVQPQLQWARPPRWGSLPKAGGPGRLRRPHFLLLPSWPKVCQKKAFLFFTWVFLAQ